MLSLVRWVTVGNTRCYKKNAPYMCINGYQSCICINGYHPVTGMIQAIHSSQHYKTGYKLGLYEHLGLERMFTFSFLKMQNHTHIYMYTHMRVCMYSPQINLFVKWWMFGHYIIFYLIFVQIFLIDLNLKKKNSNLFWLFFISFQFFSICWCAFVQSIYLG